MHALITAPVLALPDESLPYDDVCDASSSGLGAVLLQDGKPIAYESRQQTAAERNNYITEQELLSCIHALKTWRCYLEGAPEFRLHTDHGADTYLETQQKLSRRQVRWQEFLSRFDFRWDFVPCSHNVADALSRRPELSRYYRVLHSVPRCYDARLSQQSIATALSFGATGSGCNRRR